MTTHSTSPWSESLQQQTRQALDQLPTTRDGQLHFKHPTLGYAEAACDALRQECLVLHAKTGGLEHRFKDAEALLQAGWALD